MATGPLKNDIDAFERVLRAFDGERPPPDGGSSKVLRLMLAPPQGCDAVLTPGRFEIRFGWHPARHRYVPGIAPGAVACLLDFARAPHTRHIQAVIGPASVPATQLGAWSFEPRRIWIDASDERVTISVRRAEPGDGRDSPAPLPEPIDFPAPTLTEFSDPVSCPTCAEQATRFRELGGGYLVCGACGCSFPLPDSAVRAE